MSNLVRAELFKITRNHTLWVLIASVVGLSVLLHFLVIIEWWQLSGTEFDQAGLSPLNALSVFTLPLYFNLIVSPLAGFYLATEFSQSGVIKNQFLSGQKRTTIFIAKYLIFSLGAGIVTILIPLLTAVVLVVFYGQAGLFDAESIMYLGRAYGLFALQFLSFSAICALIAIATEDSGKTILFTLLVSIGMFSVEKLNTSPFITFVYENTFFYQFSGVFNDTMTSSEIGKSIVIGVLWLVVTILYGIYVFNRKEIK